MLRVLSWYRVWGRSGAYHGRFRKRMWFHDNLTCLGVFIFDQTSLPRAWRFFSCGKQQEGSMWHSLGCRRWSTPSRTPTSSSEQKVGGVISSLACMSYKSPSGFLGGVFQTEGRKFFIWRISYFLERTSRSFLRDLLGSVVSHEALPSNECST